MSASIWNPASPTNYNNSGFVSITNWLSPSFSGAQNAAGAIDLREYMLAEAGSTILVPAGVYECTDFGNLAVSNTTLLCQNGAHFKLTGTDDTALYLKAFPNDLSSEHFVQNFNIRGDLLVEGNSTTLHGVRAYGLARSQWDRVRYINGDSTNGIAFHINACSINDFGSLVCSTDVDTMTSVPKFGIYITTGTRQGLGLGASTNNTFRTMDMAGVGTGVYHHSSDFNLFVGGTAESCTNIGIEVGAGCRSNTHLNVVCEANANNDIIDAGTHTRFLNGYSLDSVAGSGRALLQGRNGIFEGGLWDRIQIDAGAADYRVSDLTVNYTNSGTGGFFDSGDRTDWNRLYDQQLAARIYPLAVRVGITVTASPFAWTNNTGRWVELIYQSGTMSAVTRSRGGVAFDCPTDAKQIFLVGPGEIVTTTYTVAPSMSYLPLNGMPG